MARVNTKTWEPSVYHNFSLRPPHSHPILIRVLYLAITASAIIQPRERELPKPLQVSGAILSVAVCSSVDS